MTAAGQGADAPLLPFTMLAAAGPSCTDDTCAVEQEERPAG